MTRYGMAIDTKRCYGCNKCSMRCKVEHNLPMDVLWTQSKTEGGEGFRVPAGTTPDTLNIMFYTLGCQHCDEPACVDVCPTGASVKREDGIVTIDYEVCIGCDSCIKACPYEGVRTHVQDPNYLMEFKSGDPTVTDVVANTVSKCTFCVERTDRGERPACVDICNAGARYFGDLDDPDSEVSLILAEREYERLNKEAGTGPNVYFLK